VLGLAAAALLGPACASLVGTRSLAGRDDAITTSFADADPRPTEWEGFALDPALYRPLLAAPRTEDGGLLLEPGVYAATVRSYCLHTGTHGPGSGDGYLHAPLKGSRSGIVRSILHNSSVHPEIPQEDVQLLVWNVLVGMKPDTFSPDQEAAARKLLSSQELLALRGGALGVIPGDALEKVLAGLPPAVQGPLRASNELRALFARGGASYEEIERIAVLPPSGEEGDVPRGRWSRHPGGFFVRYLPEDYRRTRVEVLVLEPPSDGRAARTAGAVELMPARADDGQPHGAARVYHLTGGVVMPAQPLAQRLGITGVPAPPPAAPLGGGAFSWREAAKEGEGDVGGHRCADTWALFAHPPTGFMQRCAVEVCVPYSNFQGSVSEATADEQTAVSGTAAAQRIQAQLNEGFTADICERWKLAFRDVLTRFIPGSTVSSVGTTR
jgi:hypothetical protein